MINYLNFRDAKKRRSYKAIESFNYFLKGVLFDSRVLFGNRLILKSKTSERLLKLNKKGICRIRGRCLQTGRSRFVLRVFGLSRASLRGNFSKGIMSGFRKK